MMNVKKLMYTWLFLTGRLLKFKGSFKLKGNCTSKEVQVLLNKYLAHYSVYCELFYQDSLV